MALKKPGLLSKATYLVQMQFVFLGAQPCNFDEKSTLWSLLDWGYDVYKQRL
jgi:hypothetical protein